MARVRFIGAEPVTVPELGTTVHPDELVEVPDDRFEGYVCQPQTWESVEEPRGWVWPEDEADQAEQPAADILDDSGKNTGPGFVKGLESQPALPEQEAKAGQLKKTTAAKAAPTSKEG